MQWVLCSPKEYWKEAKEIDILIEFGSIERELKFVNKEKEANQNKRRKVTDKNQVTIEVIKNEVN